MGLYTRLDASHREIRLLQILPASSPPGADHLPPPLHCELSVHRLQGINNTTRYTALSYTWGPEPSTVGGGSPANTLTVNGEVLRAPENLLLCLDAFRRRRQQGGGGGSGDGCAEYIWADAVCINQNDLQEKETQIPLMKDIYELAVQTVIWLGPAEGDSDLAMDTLECLDPKDFQAARFSAEQGRRWQAIMELLRRPWWTRTWVAQEAHLSRNPIAWCGDKQVPFEHFVVLKEFYDESYWEGQQRWLAYPLFQNIPFVTCLSNWRITKQQLLRGGDAPFSWIATTSHRLEATKVHDKIYGVLGMCYEEDRNAIAVKYDRPLRDVILQVVLRSMPTLGLLFLSFVGPEDTRCQTLMLPSWVPDLTALDITQRVNSTANPAYTFKASARDNSALWSALFQNAKLPMPPDNEFGKGSPTKETFVLYGCQCDVISYSYPMPHIPQYVGYSTHQAAENKAQRASITIDTFRRWEVLATSGHISRTTAACSATDKPVTDEYAHLPGGRKEAFWRSVCCDSGIRGERPLPRDYSERYETLLGQRGPPVGEKDDGSFEPMQNDWVREYGVPAVAKCFNKSFFLTRRGRMGTAVRGVQKDDVVIIARGSEVPYVVRRQADGTCRFVGEAYLHGVMDGEAVVEAVRLEQGAAQFVLR